MNSLQSDRSTSIENIKPMDEFRIGFEGFEIDRAWKEAMNVQLLSFANYPDDWDGQGASSPTQHTIHSAIRLMRDLRAVFHDPPTSVNLDVDGAIVIRWNSEKLVQEASVIDNAIRWTEIDLRSGQSKTRVR